MCRVGRGGECVRGFSGSVDVAGGQPDDHGGREDAGVAGSRIQTVGGPHLVEDATDRRSGNVDAALRETDKCKPRLRIEPIAARLAVGDLGGGQVAAQAQQLTVLVERHPRGGLRRIGQPVTGALRLLERLGPRAVERLDLGPVDQALAAEWHEVGLRSGPPVQRHRPLVDATQVERPVCRDDAGAVQDPGRDR